MRCGSLGPTFLAGIAAGILLGLLRTEQATALCRSEHAALFWLIGALSFALAVAAMVCVLSRRRRIGWEPVGSPEWNVNAAPPLGEMLVSYNVISQADLDRALERQKECGKRLGQVLVEMNLLTHAQVAQVLEEQLSRRENRLIWGRGEKLVS